MKNLELKLCIGSEVAFENLKKNLSCFYQKTLHQVDTYFRVPKGRLKLREEPSRKYIIRYDRPDTEQKVSQYEFYPIDDIDKFKKVFDGALDVEIVIKKERLLYIIHNARIHLDTVEGLGTFLEIEIVINNSKDDENSEEFMEELKDTYYLSQFEKIKCGYRELMINSRTKTLEYYTNTKKMFWVLADDKKFGDILMPRYSSIPCIFIEVTKGGEQKILQLDTNLKYDRHSYTAWRKVIGTIYNIRVDVLLIVENKLYALEGDEIDFKTLARSSFIIDKKYLAICAT